MSDGRPAPAEADFTKTLATVLFAEYLVVGAARGISLAWSGAAPYAGYAALALFGTVLASNILTLCISWPARNDADDGRFASVSLTMTGGQTALLIASYCVTQPLFHAVVCALTACAFVAFVALCPGKFLRPYA